MSAYSEEQIRDLIRRASAFYRDDYVREYRSHLRSTKKRYDSRKSPVHQQDDWNELEDYAYRLETRLAVLSRADEQAAVKEARRRDQELASKTATGRSHDQVIKTALIFFS